MHPRVLFIGLGNMGNPIALNILNAGITVSIFDKDISKIKKLTTVGAKELENIKEGLQNTNYVFTSLPGPSEVEKVFFGEDGIIHNALPGTIVIDLSTSSVDLSKKIYHLAKEKKINYLEAPITNGVDAAKSGNLSIFVGGSKKYFVKSKPILDLIGNKVIYVGEAGNGAIIKLLTNLLWFIGAAAIGEGLMLGAKAGIPLKIVWEAIKSSAGNSWVAEHDVPSIFAGNYDPSFSLSLCCKDLDLINEIASSQGYSLELGNLVKSLFNEAKEKYGESAGELHVVKLLEDRVGLLLRNSD